MQAGGACGAPWVFTLRPVTPDGPQLGLLPEVDLSTVAANAVATRLLPGRASGDGESQGGQQMCRRIGTRDAVAVAPNGRQ